MRQLLLFITLFILLYGTGCQQVACLVDPDPKFRVDLEAPAKTTLADPEPVVCKIAYGKEGCGSLLAPPPGARFTGTLSWSYSPTYCNAEPVCFQFLVGDWFDVSGPMTDNMNLFPVRGAGFYCLTISIADDYGVEHDLKNVIVEVE